MKTAMDLKRLLQSVDRKGYPAYKSLAGGYAFDGYTLWIDHVQGDPFASPSKLRIVVDQRTAGFSETLFDLPHKRIALQDHLTRLFYSAIRRFAGRMEAGGGAHGRGAGSGNSGRVSVCRCGQEVLDCSAVQLDTKKLEARVEVGFPARGRTINAPELEHVLFDALPQIVRHSLLYRSIDRALVADAVALSEDQQAIRDALAEHALVSFVADGAILPRESGVSERPLAGGLPFCAPESLRVTLELPHAGRVTGMGIPRGITLIVGGGYHGKSTLLRALESGVYNHIRGDGREFVITDATAVKVRAEDGRSIRDTDISLFINNLPNQKDTRRFSTENASGSTSQAANMAEAMEAGTRLFLIDEDTSATNFMIRDEIMQKLISREMEPITPFTDMVRPLYEQQGISTVLVVGSSGTYFRLADTVIQMENYEPKDITQRAKSLCPPEGETAAPDCSVRFSRIIEKGFVERGPKGVKIRAHGLDTLTVNREDIDLRYLEQLVCEQQLAALGYLMRYAEERVIDGKRTLCEVADELERVMDEGGLLAIATGAYCADFLARPRRQEIMACFNRYRRLRVTQR